MGNGHLLENPHSSSAWLASVNFDMLASGMTRAPGGCGASSRDDLEERPLAIIAAAPFFMGASGMPYSHKSLSINNLYHCQTGHRNEDCSYIRPVFDWNSS